MWEQDETQVRDAVQRLGEFEATRDVAFYLETNASEFANRCAARIVEEIPDYSLLMSGDDLSETWRHGREHALHIASMLSNGHGPALDFVTALGQHRAEQGFPLRHVLHTYRIGHRITADLLMAGVDDAEPDAGIRTELTRQLFEFTIHYTHLISRRVTQSYSQRQRDLGSVTEQRTRDFFEGLLNGLPLDPEVLAFARAGGLEKHRLHLCVIRSEDPEAPPPDTAALQSFAPRDERPMLAAQLDDELLCLTPWPDDLEDDVYGKDAIEMLARTGRLLMGVSSALTRADQGRPAYREALFAVSLANPEQRVVRIDNIPLSELRLDRAELDVSRLLPTWVGDWRQLNTGQREDLERTISSFADANMHISAAGEALGVHPNTIRFRLRKIEEVTGLDARRFHDLTELRTVLRLTGATPGPDPAASR